MIPTLTGGGRTRDRVSPGTSKEDLRGIAEGYVVRDVLREKEDLSPMWVMVSKQECRTSARKKLG